MALLLLSAGSADNRKSSGRTAPRAGPTRCSCGSGNPRPGGHRRATGAGTSQARPTPAHSRVPTSRRPRSHRPAVALIAFSRAAALSPFTVPALRSGLRPQRFSASHTYMLPSPATLRWSSSAAFKGALEPSSALISALASNEGSSGSGPQIGEARIGRQRRRIDQIDDAEAARIGVADRRTIVGAELDMIVRTVLAGLLDEHETPRHAQMHEQRGLAIQRHDDPFGAAFDRRDACTRRALHEIHRDRRADVGPALHDGGKAAADQMRTQAADDGFDFGQLRHDVRDPAPCALPFSSGACYGAPRNDASD